MEEFIEGTNPRTNERNDSINISLIIILLIISTLIISILLLVLFISYRSRVEKNLQEFKNEETDSSNILKRFLDDIPNILEE